MGNIERLLAVQNELGESPLWHPQEKALYWVDICARPAVFRYFPAQKRLEHFPVGTAISAVAWRGGGGLVAATRSGLAFWQAESGITLLHNPLAARPAARLNDGAVDHQGRFWVGAMQTGSTENCLYRFDAALHTDVMDCGFIVSNGIGWSPDGHTMYFTDSYQHAIFAYDFDPESGNIADRRTWVSTGDEPGVPDGLTVDAQGGVWSAFCRGGKVIRYTPTGKKDLEITLPVSCPTSLTFGGELLNELYITSSWGLLQPDERLSQPMAGDLLRLQTEFTGIPETGYAG